MKLFQDGEIIKEAFVEAADSLFVNFKNKNDIMSASKDLQLSRNTVTKRFEGMEENLAAPLERDIGGFHFNLMSQQTLWIRRNYAFL